MLTVNESTRTDVLIEGMLLPKGSTLLINLWGLHQDEQRYENPDTFDPERYAGFTQLAHDYAVSTDYEARDHYSYGESQLHSVVCWSVSQPAVGQCSCVRVCGCRGRSQIVSWDSPRRTKSVHCGRKVDLGFFVREGLG